MKWFTIKTKFNFNFKKSLNRLICLCSHLEAQCPSLSSPALSGKAALPPFCSCSCVVLICSEGSADPHHHSTGSIYSVGMQQHCWFSGILLLSVFSNQYLLISLWAGFFFLNPIMYCSRLGVQLCAWGKHPKAFGQFCFSTTLMFHPLHNKPWLACGSWQTIFCWTATTVTRPNPSAGHYSGGFGSSGNPNKRGYLISVLCAEDQRWLWF